MTISRYKRAIIYPEITNRGKKPVYLDDVSVEELFSGNMLRIRGTRSILQSLDDYLVVAPWSGVSYPNLPDDWPLKAGFPRRPTFFEKLFNKPGPFFTKECPREHRFIYIKNYETIVSTNCVRLFRKIND